MINSKKKFSNLNSVYCSCCFKNNMKYEIVSKEIDGFLLPDDFEVLICKNCGEIELSDDERELLGLHVVKTKQYEKSSKVNPYDDLPYQEYENL